jgi:hypothetical protein
MLPKRHTAALVYRDLTGMRGCCCDSAHTRVAYPELPGTGGSGFWFRGDMEDTTDLRTD